MPETFRSVKGHEMVERGVVYFEDCLIHTARSSVFQVRLFGRHRASIAGVIPSTSQNQLSTTILFAAVCCLTSAQAELHSQSATSCAAVPCLLLSVLGRSLGNARSASAFLRSCIRYAHCRHVISLLKRNLLSLSCKIVSSNNSQCNDDQTAVPLE